MREKFIQKINDPNQNILKILYESGFTSDLIKEFVVHTLSPYVKNEILQKYGANFMAFEACNIASMENDESIDFFRIFLSRYNTLVEKEHNFVLKMMAFWNQDIYEGQRRIPIDFKRKDKPEDLDLEELEHQVFNTIRILVESGIQPYLGETLALEKTKSIENIKQMSLGTLVKAVNGLVQEPQNLLDTFFAPEPWGLMLHDWRNIAAHDGSRQVRGEEIFCTYNNGKKQIILSRNEILEVEAKLGKRLAALKSAREIFIFNHLIEISNSLDFQHSLGLVELNFEAVYLDLSYTCLAQGFEICCVNEKNKSIVFSIKDAELLPERILEVKLLELISFGCKALSHFREKDIILIYEISEKDSTIEIVIEGSKIAANLLPLLNSKELSKYISIKEVKLEA